MKPEIWATFSGIIFQKLNFLLGILGGTLPLRFTTTLGEIPPPPRAEIVQICMKTTEKNLPTHIEVAALVPHLFDESHGKGIVHKDLPGIHKVNKNT